jgi:hypothetical protein
MKVRRYFNALEVKPDKKRDHIITGGCMFQEDIRSSNKTGERRLYDRLDYVSINIE